MDLVFAILLRKPDPELTPGEACHQAPPPGDDGGCHKALRRLAPRVHGNARQPKPCLSRILGLAVLRPLEHPKRRGECVSCDCEAGGSLRGWTPEPQVA